MSKTRWVDLYELTELQHKIMFFIQEFVRSEKKPVPHALIIKSMQEEGIKDYTTVSALQKLLKDHYIRRAIITSNKTFYVALKTVR